MRYKVKLKCKSEMARVKENGWWKLVPSSTFIVREATKQDVLECQGEYHYSNYYCVDIESGSIINKKAVKKVEVL